MTPNPSTERDGSRGSSRQRPVVVLTVPALIDVVLATVRQAGGSPDVLTTRPAESRNLDDALSSDHEVIVVVCEPPETATVITTLRALDARVVPALTLRHGAGGPVVSEACLSLLSDPRIVDLEIPVPAADDDATRRLLWDQLRSVRAEERHHLVEVDGRPALPGGADWAHRAAGAAGVLAGRMAAANRRWRAQLDV